jgi:DinB superfamily
LAAVASRLLPVDETLTALAETPSRLAAATRGVSAAALAAPLQPGEWSGVEILAHLRACADLWGANALAMAQGRDADIRTTDPESWPKRSAYLKLSFAGSLRALARQRAQLLGVLEPLAREEWTRTITVLTWGQQYPRNVLFYADRIAGHERSHCRHLERLFLGRARRP